MTLRERWNDFLDAWRYLGAQPGAMWFMGLLAGFNIGVVIGVVMTKH